MKIESYLVNVYHFENDEHGYEENGNFYYFQLETNFELIDKKSNTIINLGTLAFQNGEFDYNYRADKDCWQFYSDASCGIVETIYYNIATKKEKKCDIEKIIDINIDEILDDVNDYTTKLKEYINNDKKKLKKFLILLSKKIISKQPTYSFCKKNITETI